MNDLKESMLRINRRIIRGLIDSEAAYAKLKEKEELNRRLETGIQLEFDFGSGKA
jgi:hypothetical protein